MRQVATRGIGLLALVLLVSFTWACSEEPEPGNGSNGVRTCLRTEDCRADEVCSAGLCVPSSSTGCLRDSDCPEGHRCDGLTASCIRDHEGPPPVCQPGETRCKDGIRLEICSDLGTEWLVEECEHECRDGVCVVCSPGAARCEEQVSLVCDAFGSGWVEQDCALLGVDCVDGRCLVCSPGERRCVDRSVFEMCNNFGSGWDDYACLDGECDPETGQCVEDGCTPGRYTCQGNDRMLCDDDGETWLLIEDCSVGGGGCVGGRCTNLCAEAAASNSYIGCEYWPVVLSNIELVSVFQDDFAVVVGNPSLSLVAEVSVYRHGSSVPVATASITPGGLEVIRLPWNQMSATESSTWLGTLTAITRKGLTAYRLQSSIPVTAYQFNPLRSKIGNTYSHTNDASLLLPTHVFGSSSRYLALSVPHIKFGSDDQPTYVAIVATEDATEVSIRVRGYTAAGAGLPELGPGDQRTVTLNRHEVLQLASRADGGDVEEASIGSVRLRKYNRSDLSGTIIDSNKPIAVFAGADCHWVPFDKTACDHLEQQLYPFHNWGSSYVGVPGRMPRGGTFDAGNLFRILAGVDGTQVSFIPASVHENVTLAAGEVLELQTRERFFVQSQGTDYPILMGQWLLGQNAFCHWGQPCADVGDPSMILSVPTEQYRTDYHFTTVDTISDNFINVVRRTSALVNLNGQPLTGCWVTVGTTDFEVCRHDLPGGNHRITSQVPVGVVVYGYDEYVSYGYPAGLELQRIAVPDPGW